MRLKRFWRSPKTTSSEDSGGCESPTKITIHSPSKQQQQQQRNPLVASPIKHSNNKQPPTCSLPLLQVWPSQDSPRGEADGQSFIFPILSDDPNQTDYRRNSLYCESFIAGDSGIDSVQASPSPNATLPLLTSPNGGAEHLPCGSGASPTTTPQGSPTPSIHKSKRRPSSALLHPDHARLFALRQQQQSSSSTSQLQQQMSSPDQVSFYLIK